MARSKRITTGRTRALFVRIETKSGYEGAEFEVKGSVVTAHIGGNDGQEALEVKNVGRLFNYADRPEKSDSRHAIDDNDLGDLEISGRAQLDKYADFAPRTWGCWAAFDSSLIFAKDAARYLRTLNRIDRALESQPDFNHKRDGLGEWFKVAADAIGAEAIIFPIREGSLYSQGEYVALAPDEAAARIEREYAAWVARVAQQHVAAVS